MDETRCDITDLPVSGCSHCRGIPDRTRTVELGPPVTARYEGECSGCAEPIEIGDTIRSDGQGGWRAACCPDDVDD